MRIRPLNGADFEPASRILGSTWYGHHEGHAMWYGADELCVHLARSDGGFAALDDDGRLLGIILLASPRPEDRNAEMRRHWRQQRKAMATIAGAMGIDVAADPGMALVKEENALLDETVREQGAQGVIVLVIVDAEARGKGVGRGLIAEATGWLIDHGAAGVSLVTDSECDWQLYEHLDMDRTAERDSVAMPGMAIYVYQSGVADLRARVVPDEAREDAGEIQILPSDGGLDEWIGSVIDEHAAKAGVRVASYRYRVEEGGRVVAGISAWAMGPYVHIDMLAVDESQRRRGLGARLVARVEEEARRDGCATASVDTLSFQAPDYYPSLGYAETHRYQLDDGTERIFFAKRL